jgi:antitoxin component YwqK of YwqJK toxin-antitoxin module
MEEEEKVQGEERLRSQLANVGEDHLVWTIWYENGNKKEEITLKRPTSVPYGSLVVFNAETVFYTDGTLADPFSGKKSIPRRDGTDLGWYENGHKSREYNWKDGKRDGLSSEWFKSGQKSVEGTYNDGEKVGRWNHYNEDGSTKEVHDHDGV